MTRYRKCHNSCSRIIKCSWRSITRSSCQSNCVLPSSNKIMNSSIINMFITNSTSNYRCKCFRCTNTRFFLNYCIYNIWFLWIRKYSSCNTSTTRTSKSNTCHGYFTTHPKTMWSHCSYCSKSSRFIIIHIENCGYSSLNSCNI